MMMSQYSFVNYICGMPGIRLDTVMEERTLEVSLMKL
jgi:hypothetical protein